MRIEKIYCDVCKKELIEDGVRRIRSCPEYNFTDLCDDCYLKVDEILKETRNKYTQVLDERDKKIKELLGE